MAGVAEQDDEAVGPARQRIALEQRPLVHARTGGQQALHVLVEAGQRLANLAHLAARRPGLHVPVRIGHAGDEVDLVPPRVHGIDDDVPVRTPPLGAGIDNEIPHQRGREHCAVRDPPGELGLLGAEQDLAHQRVDPVGADDGVRGCALPVGKAQSDAGAVALEADELLLVGDQLRRHGGEEGRVQIAAMHQEIGRAVALLGLGAEGQLGQVLAGVPHAGSPRTRLEGLPPQLRL